MRSDSLYLRDIVEAADAIGRFLIDAPEERFLLNELQQSAILQKLIVIGEAAARISEAIRTAYPHVPWQDIVAFRNIAVHAYFSVDWTIVWNAATVDVPALKIQIESILRDTADSED